MTKRREGYVLVAVLWAMVAIAGLSLGTATYSRVKRLQIRNSLDAAQAENTYLTAEAYVEASLNSMQIQDARGDKWFAAHMTTLQGMENSFRFTVRLEDADSRLNLNAASAVQIATLLNACRVADYSSEAARIVVAQGENVFQSIEQAVDLAALQRGTAQCLGQFVGVTGDGLINLNTAPDEVLGTLPGFGQASVQYIRNEIRQNRRIFSVLQILNGIAGPEQTALGAVLPTTQSLSSTTTRFITAYIEVTRADGGMVLSGSTSFRREGTNARKVGSRRTW
jgi:type II secretory pathway component PulK